MIPNIIVVTSRGPQEGADITALYIRVREENKDLLLMHLSHLFPNNTFEIMSEKEFENYYENKFCKSEGEETPTRSSK